MEKFDKMVLIILGIIISLLIIFALYIVSNKESVTTDLDVLKQNGVAITDLEGNPVIIESADKILVIYHWASWSPNTKNDLTTLNSHIARYDNKSIMAVALNRSESTKIAQKFIDELPDYQFITYVIDTNDSVYPSLQGTTMPEWVIFDKTGTLRFHNKSTITASLLREQLLKIGAEPLQ